MGAPDNLQILCQFHPACSAALRGALHESGAPILQTRSVAEGLQNKLLTRGGEQPVDLSEHAELIFDSEAVKRDGASRRVQQRVSIVYMQ